MIIEGFNLRDVCHSCQYTNHFKIEAGVRPCKEGLQRWLVVIMECTNPLCKKTEKFEHEWIWYG
jgi:hypothetical protein